MENLSPEEQAVYDLICANNRITQLQICKSEKWLGISKHEEHLNIDKRESTLRRIREIIRGMRLKHNLPILSDTSGYYILKTDAEAELYIKRLERSAKAAAKSFMVTYAVMKKTLGVKSDYFEEAEKLASTPSVAERSKAIQKTVKEANKIIVREHIRRKNNGDEFPPQQNRLF